MEEPTHQPLTREQSQALLGFPRQYKYTPGQFRETFQTPLFAYAHRIGHKFTVVKTCDDNYCADHQSVPIEDVEPMYLIRFEDGQEIVAWGEEVCV